MADNLTPPKNVLHSFRSYSYHHILVACDSAETAMELSKNSEITTFYHSDSSSKFNTNTNKKGSFIVLINGMSDSEFSIKSAKWATVMSPTTASSDGQKYADTMEQDGELVIQEPRGVRFLNVLANVCDSLQTDPNGLVFLLKTIFVGENGDGTTDIISTIRPTLFNSVDITAIIDEAGAVYTFSFVGINNGVGKLPFVSRLAQGFSMALEDETNKSNQLASVLTTALSKISNSWDNYKEQLKIQQSKSNDPALKSINFDDDFRQVRYTIEVDELYENPVYVAGSNSKVQQKNKENDAIVHFGPDVGIEEVIRGIMDSCKQVKTDARGTQEGKFIYKITSTLRSNAEEYIVEYHVHQYKLVTNPYAQDGEFNPTPGEFMEFDYIFTGKNVDIIEFDIKMEMGMAFFQTVATTNNIMQQRGSMVDQQNAGGGAGGLGTASEGKKKRNKTPLFLGTKLKNPVVRNAQYPVDTQTFDAMLARHAAFENIEVQLKIHGNPQLLDEMALLPSEMAKGVVEESKEGKTINPRWLKTPSLAKVNIRMPTNDKDEDYSKPFWYQGFYMIFTVNNIFSEGLFTQELELISLPVTSPIDDSFTDDPPETPTAQTSSTTGGPAEGQTVAEKVNNRKRS